MKALRRWNVEIGNFFFRWRNALFPAVFAVTLITLRPQVIPGRPRLDHLLVLAGFVAALAGEAVRLATIGFEYIDRGGKNKRVAASRLVRAGVYAHTRNPMYLGNLLIALGICMAAGSPAALLVVFPFFLFVYQAIVSAEEQFLLEKFGPEYARYCETVPRFFPSFKGWRNSFAGMEYDWRRSFRQDLGTITTVSVWLVLLPLWRNYFLYGGPAAKLALPSTLSRLAGVLVLYAFLVFLKKQRLVFYEKV